MKFTVRAGYAVVFPEMNGRNRRGELVVTHDEKRCFAGETLELSEEQATEHLHKLEPADAAALRFLESKVAIHTGPDQLPALAAKSSRHSA